MFRREVCFALEKGEQCTVGDDPHLDDLGKTGAEMSLGQSCQETLVHQHKLRREVASQIALVAVEIHGPFYPDCCVDLSDESRRSTNLRDPRRMVAAAIVVRSMHTPPPMATRTALRSRPASRAAVQISWTFSCVFCSSLQTRTRVGTERFNRSAHSPSSGCVTFRSTVGVVTTSACRSWSARTRVPRPPRKSRGSHGVRRSHPSARMGCA